MLILKKITVAFLFTAALITAAPSQEAKTKRPKVALVLSGGGALGLAEIPLLEAMEREGIKPDMILGTSMGTLLGALYASGYSAKEIRSIMLELDLMSIVSDWTVPHNKIPAHAFSTRNDNYFSASFSLKDKKLGAAPAVLGDQEILNTLSSYLSKVGTVDDFDKLPIPFRAITTDISTNKEKIYKSGSIVKAIRGSMSLPAIWVPCRMDDGTYVMDGGLQNNAPIQEAFDMGADVVIAMDSASKVYVDPQSIDDLVSTGFRLFNLVISKTALEQHKLANLLMIPNLDEFHTADFSKAAGIIEAGEKCVEENREALQKLAVELHEAGVPYVQLDYDRESIYSKLPVRTVEKIYVKDISFKKPVPLPDDKIFAEFNNRPLDEHTQKSLVRLLDDLRVRYHLESLSFEVLNGSDESKCIVEIQANHYEENASRLFFGGQSFFSLTNFNSNPKSGFKFSLVPDFTTGIYSAKEPFEFNVKFTAGNTDTASLELSPRLLRAGEGELHFDLGGDFNIGSLEPGSNTTFVNRTADDDKGLSAHAALEFRYSDFITATAGIKYDYSFIDAADKDYHTAYGYVDSVINTYRDEVTGTKGLKLELLVTKGKDSSYGPVYSAGFNYRQNFEITRNLTSVRLSLTGMTVRFPYQLNSGYADFGGINGMCGYPFFTYKRDYAIAGLSFIKRTFVLGGMPVYLLLDAKAGACDDYNAYDPANQPDNALFSGFDGINSVIGGFGAYLALKTPVGHLTFGCSANTKGKYTVLLGFM